MLSRTISAAVQGVDAYLVSVEVDIASGLPTFAMVGLPDAAVKESRDRVVAAVRNSGFDFPTRRVTVNLAPADVKKEGAAFDLPIAVGIVTAQGEVKTDGLEDYCLIGELALDGTLRPVRGILSIVLALQKEKVRNIIVPQENASEAAIVGDVAIFPATTLSQVVRFLNGEEQISPLQAVPGDSLADENAIELDFSDVKGQQSAKRAMEVAAAGGHNIVMMGPPGSGKTMLAKRLPGILPPLSFDEAVETTKIHSVAGLLARGQGLAMMRPFRSPHHTTSAIALIGGGSYPRPGEVSLAHNGVLFLDEMTELHRDVLEVLRQPLEDHVVTVARAKISLRFPASFMLVGAMNPCPCGNYGRPDKECLCTPYQIQKYRAKISGPLLDRIDIHLEIPALKVAELTEESAPGEPSSAVRQRVVRAREIQRRRFAGARIHCNSQMHSRLIRKHCMPNEAGKKLLRLAIERLALSGRAYDRILKVSRTIADLDASERIEERHVAEAVQYRAMDRL